MRLSTIKVLLFSHFSYGVVGQGYVSIKNSFLNDHCIDLEGGGSSTANLVKAVTNVCDGTPSQKWQVDSTGRIHSFVNPSKCLETGNNADADMIIYTCNNAVHQRYVFSSDGRIEQQLNTGQYLGLANGCSTVSAGGYIHRQSNPDNGCPQQIWIQVDDTKPSASPSFQPSTKPSVQASLKPSMKPSSNPSSASEMPSAMPSTSKSGKTQRASKAPKATATSLQAQEMISSGSHHSASMISPLYVVVTIVGGMMALTSH